MAEEQVQLNALQSTKDQAEIGFWLKQINGDALFVQHMIELYEKQQLNEQLNEQRHSKMTHRSRASSISSPSTSQFQQPGRHLSRLNDEITSSSIQYQHLLINRNTNLSKDPPSPTADDQTSSTPRRPLDDSNSSVFQSQRRTKKARPQVVDHQEITKTLYDYYTEQAKEPLVDKNNKHDREIDDEYKLIVNDITSTDNLQLEPVSVSEMQKLIRKLKNKKSLVMMRFRTI